MPPKRKGAQSSSLKVKSLDVSAEEALELKNELERGSGGLERIPVGTLARLLGVRGGCHVVVDVEEDKTDAKVDGDGDDEKNFHKVGAAKQTTSGDEKINLADGAGEKDGPSKKREKREPACKGMALNPACLCGLIPESDTKYRKTGLWSRGAKKVDEDELPTKRTAKQNRAGLENLGNTCYINSVLQTLFSIEDFKRAVLEAWMHQEENIDDMENASHPVHVLQALKDIFVKLEVGPESVVDPAPLITALRLDTSVQQDGHEFMKLFLTLLEQVPELSAHSLFRGRSGYQTTCMSCNKLSQSSQRFDDFLELDIPIKGFSGLQESLGTLLCPEILDGDNQYFCAHCDGKRDATRQLIVKDLPPVLCLSLQRFVFDLKKMDRVKANDKFSFPLELPASMITHEGSDVYDLEGILLHKGSSARQGHYVAHVNSEGKWYRFDDGDVTILENGPQAHPDHGARTAGTSIKPPVKKKGKKRGRKKKGAENVDGAGIEVQESDDGEEKWAQCENPSCSKWRILPKGAVVNPEEPWYCSMNPDTKHNSCDAPEAEWDRDEYEQQQLEAGLVTSSNAYLLVYKRRDKSAASSGAQAGAQVSLSGDAAKASAKTATKSIENKERKASYPAALTKWLKNEKNKLAAEFQRKAEVHQRLSDETCRQVDHRRELIRGIVNASRNAESEENAYFVTSSWLETWANAEPKDCVPAVDNQALLCPHNLLDPSKVQASKRLSKGSWEQIVEMYGGKPALNVKNTCRECLLEQLDSILLQEDVEVNRELYLAMCDELDLDSGNGSLVKKGADRQYRDGDEGEDSKLATEGEGATSGNDEETLKDKPSITTGYFVGKQWLKNWRGRKGASMGSSSPTSSLVCEHGLLIPSHPDRPSTRVLIPADFWAYLKRSWSAKVAAEDRKDRFKQAERKKKASGKGNASKKQKVDDGEVEIIADTMVQEMTLGADAVNTATNKSFPNAELKEFVQDAPECPQCREELLSQLETHPKKEEEKSALRHLVSASQNLNMEPNVAYKMVPVEFLSEWRAYMGPSKAAKDPPELTPCMQAVACSTHGSLKVAFPSPPLISRRGRWMYANGSDEMFEIITEADWEKLWAAYGNNETPFGAEGISVYLSEVEILDKANGPCEVRDNGEKRSKADQSGDAKLEQRSAAGTPPDARTSDKKSSYKTKTSVSEKDAPAPEVSKNFTCVTVPEVCEECIIDREKAIRASLLNFESQEVMVEIVADEAAATGLKITEGNQRHSKRARKNRAPILVDSTTTLENAKLRMFEALGVHPKNIRAFLRGTELLDDSKELLHYEVVPTDEIRIVDTGVFDVNDLASIFPDVVFTDRVDDGSREGFTGTALHGMH